MVGMGFWFRNFGVGGAPTTESTAWAAAKHGAESVHVACQKGIGQRQTALTRPAHKAGAEVLFRQIRGVIDPFRHD